MPLGSQRRSYHSYYYLRYLSVVGPPDVGIFRAINHWPQSLGPMMRFFSEALNHPLIKVLLGLLLIGMVAANSLTRKTVLQALISVGIANTITDVFKHRLPMHRPFQELPDVHLWVGWSNSAGTASAHSANMAAVAVIFVYHLKWWGSPWVPIAAMVGISRVFCGAHYPYQVLLGWTVGVVTATTIAKGWDWIQVRRAPELSENDHSIPEPKSESL